MTTLHVPANATFDSVLGRAAQRAPEAFAEGRLRNLSEGSWNDLGEPAMMISPVDGSSTVALAKVSAADAEAAVDAAVAAHVTWSTVPLAERKSRVTAAVDAMAEARDDLALLLGWEIGKPWRLACADVDRGLDGVRWYVENIEGMLATDVDGNPFQRTPLPGPVSNIASWNYPLSVQVHAELIQLLAGNAVVAKTPTQGGAITLTLAHALMVREGLPVTLLSGDGSTLSDALVRHSGLGALAFVGGRSNGGRVAAQLVDTGKRHFLEQEGLNTWGIWDFSDWDGLAAHLKKGYEYGKQRCTAYPRYVVQRALVPDFLAMYLPLVASIKVGHPLAVAADGDPLPELDFGPVISRRQGGGAEFKGGGGAALGCGAAVPGCAGPGPVYRRPGHQCLCGAGCDAGTAGREPVDARGALRSSRLDRGRRHPGRVGRADERVDRRAGGQHRLRRRAAGQRDDRASAGVQGRHQQAAFTR